MKKITERWKLDILETCLNEFRADINNDQTFYTVEHVTQCMRCGWVQTEWNREKKIFQNQYMIDNGLTETREALVQFLEEITSR